MPTSTEEKSKATFLIAIAGALLLGLLLVSLIVAPIAWQKIREDRIRTQVIDNMKTMKKALDDYEAKQKAAEQQ
jgi:hypothetical protein